jgi:hypothetical protein
MHVRFKLPKSRLPWALAFSFARAIQRSALEIWAATRPTDRRRGRLCTIAPSAIGPHSAANTTPQWKGYERYHEHSQTTISSA